jgi:hypothetical protein
MTNHELFGIFMLNPFHNIVHIGLGAFWLLAAFALTPAGTQGVNIAIGGIYALATVLGILGYFSLLSIPGGVAIGDNWLHLVTAVVTLIFGSGVLSGGREVATAYLVSQCAGINRRCRHPGVAQSCVGRQIPAARIDCCP